MLDTLANELVGQYVFFHTLEMVGDDGWWRLHFPMNNKEEVKKQYRDHYLRRTRWWHFIVFWSKLEANLRLLCKHLYDEKLSRGDYWEVYTKILKELNISNLTEFFEYWSVIRNLIHNDFHFRPKNNSEKKTKYRGKEKIFIPNKLFNEFSISDAMDIYEDTYDAVVKIITSAEILKHEFIGDKWV